MNQSIKKINQLLSVSNLPNCPGVYLYYDKNETILYVGKAKNLKKRISSYFNKTHDNKKTQLLVKKTKKIDYLIVESEGDALLLENNLIKKHQPKYNILLKDDKSYPWIVIYNEPFPRIKLTRCWEMHDKSHYYGPYTSIHQAKYLLKTIYSLYFIRTCNHALDNNKIKKNKFNLCLRYHLKQCLAPCIGKQTEEEYNKNIRIAEKILQGKHQNINKILYKQMINLAKEMRFEEAEIIKNRRSVLEHYIATSIIVNQNIHNIDVFSFAEDKQFGYINYLHIVYGAIVHVYTISYKKKLNESREFILSIGIAELRLRFNSKAKEIIVPFQPETKINSIIFTIPKRGEKKKLLQLSEKNIQQYKINQLNKIEKINSEQDSLQILKILQKELYLKTIPFHIECFDNSNTQGTYPVSSCIVFKNTKPAKKEYRHFNIKTVKGIDDCRSIYESVFRRYHNVTKPEQQQLPDLIIIDGGKGQLHAATNALKDLNIYERIHIVSIAKKSEKIYSPNHSIPICLNKNSKGLKLIQKLRNEAHRFGIFFHRKKRNKFQSISILDNILGIGNLTKNKLLLKYKSIQRIKQAPQQEIINLIGEKKAHKLMKFF